MAMLTIAKLCAGALFPSISICVLSKCYAMRYYLNNSWLTFIVDFEPTHHLHTCEFLGCKGETKIGRVFTGFVRGEREWAGLKPEEAGPEMMSNIFTRRDRIFC